MSEVALAFVVLTLIVIGIGGVWLFWRTSDEYRISMTKKKLGYPVKEWWYYPSLIFGLCMGPILRKNWEKKNKFYTSENYGAPDSDWEQIIPGQAWQTLPRGDLKLRRDLTNAVVATCFELIVQETISLAVTSAASSQAQGDSSDAFHAAHQQMTHMAGLLSAIQAFEDGSSDPPAVHVHEWSDPNEESDSEEETELPKNAVVSDVARRKSMGLSVVIQSQPRSSLMGQDDVAVVLEQEPVAKSRVLSQQELQEFLKKEDFEDAIMEEFEDLPAIVPDMAQILPGSQIFNRSAKSLPFKKNRVSVGAGPVNDLQAYINASFVSGASAGPRKYIVTQEPLSGAEIQKQSTFHRFWQMVSEQQPRVIVMFPEQHQKERPSRYWPARELLHRSFPDVSVENRETLQSDSFILSTLAVRRSDGDSFNVAHLQYLKPFIADDESSLRGLLQFAAQVNRIQDQAAVPVIVHDFIGINEASVFIALCEGLIQLQTTGAVDVPRILTSLRHDRSGSLQNFSHYEFLYCVLAYATTWTPSAEAPSDLRPASRRESSQQEDSVPGPIEGADPPQMFTLSARTISSRYEPVLGTLDSFAHLSFPLPSFSPRNQPCAPTRRT
eukprot:m.266481 g.266481  ORF g.266481 m.266481 type:complete len:610 (-) comp54699_c0_seq11:141-1970(-)